MPSAYAAVIELLHMPSYFIVGFVSAVNWTVDEASWHDLTVWNTQDRSDLY